MVLQVSPLRLPLTTVLPAPALSADGVAVAVLPEEVVSPYSKLSVVAAPLSLAVPAIVAPVAVMLLALPVVAVGAAAYEKLVLAPVALVPPTVVTVTSTAPCAWAGAVAVIWVGELTV